MLPSRRQEGSVSLHSLLYALFALKKSNPYGSLSPQFRARASWIYYVVRLSDRANLPHFRLHPALPPAIPHGTSVSCGEEESSV
jgi:hypothetical protein